MSLQYRKKELSYKVDVLHADKHEHLLQVDVFFDGFGQACRNYLGKFAVLLRHLKKEDSNEVGDLTVLASLLLKFTLRFHLTYTTFKIYYTSNVFKIQTVTYPEFFWADRYHPVVPPPLFRHPGWQKFLNLVPPDALKMHSLSVPVLRFLCKTFSKLLKLNNETLFSVDVLKKIASKLVSRAPKRPGYITGRA